MYMNNKNIAISVLILVVIVVGAVWYAASVENTPPPTTLEYKNTQYSFTFSLPLSWQGYSIVTDTWKGYTSGAQGDAPTETGPLIYIRHPQWTEQASRQDIPIMVFTLQQWNSLQQEKFHIGAAPIGPSELGRNAKYVFALPARYNYAFPLGYQEVDAILKNNPLNTFSPK